MPDTVTPLSTAAYLVEHYGLDAIDHASRRSTEYKEAKRLTGERFWLAVVDEIFDILIARDAYTREITP